MIVTVIMRRDRDGVVISVGLFDSGHHRHLSVRGTVLKRWIRGYRPQVYPLRCARCWGAVLAVWMSRELSPLVLLQGMFSGLAATGPHQAFSPRLLKETFQKQRRSLDKMTISSSAFL